MPSMSESCCSWSAVAGLHTLVGQFSLVCVLLWSPDVSGVSGKLVEVWWWLLLVLRGVSPSQRSTVQKVRVGGAAGGLW